jgi:ferredoxin
MKSLRIISFSPTGTTRRVLEGIAQGLAFKRVEHLDLTYKRARTGAIRDIDEDLALIGTPVYVGRVPVQAAEALRSIRAVGSPAVFVVVYGNRAYDYALLELKGIVEEMGLRPLAAAAFIGEHSFSTVATPLAAGRPDIKDLQKATSFGELLRGTVERRWRRREVNSLDIPGKLRFRERVSRDICPESREGLCTLCRKCEEVCPQEAITSAGSSIETDRGKCILCCACVKSCPTGARRVTDPRMSRLVQKLAVLCRERKEPEFFFPK